MLKLNNLTHQKAHLGSKTRLLTKFGGCASHGVTCGQDETKKGKK